MKDRILSDEGRRQQAKLRELAVIAERLGCSMSQLAIGKLMSFSAHVFQNPLPLGVRVSIFVTVMIVRRMLALFKVKDETYTSIAFCRNFRLPNKLA